MKHVTGGAKGSSQKQDENVRKDRKSASGVNGSPKKGGHGGKFTWAGDVSYAEEEIEARRAVNVDETGKEE